jgi:hypothetical protein
MPKLPTGNPDNLQPSVRDCVVRVFISSTFRDAVEDRAELMVRAWPDLRRLWRGRVVGLVGTNLRWACKDMKGLLP